jgi:hypothetical protein
MEHTISIKVNIPDNLQLADKPIRIISDHIGAGYRKDGTRVLNLTCCVELEPATTKADQR